MTALLLTLFVKSALIVGIALAVTKLLRAHTAATRHAVWTCALVALIALPVLTAMLPPVRVPLPLAALVSSTVSEFSPSTATQLTEIAPRTSARPPRTVVSGDDAAAAVSTRDIVLRVFIVAWLIGVVLLGARRVIAEGRARLLVRRATPAANVWQRRCAELARPLRVQRAVELRVSAALSTPAVAGITRAVILLPDDAERWTATDLDAVLQHELGHVARWDGLTNVVADSVSILYWCNPLVRVAVRRLRVESERACDDLVLRAGTDAAGYAQLLLAFARTARVPDALTAASSAIVRPRELEARLVAILDAHTRREPVRRGLPALFATLALLMVAPTAAATIVASAASPLPTLPLLAPEPDQADDAFASPQSERLPLPPDAYRITTTVRAALRGRDSMLVAMLIDALALQPRHEADLVRERAAWALTQIRHGLLVEPLLAALEHRDWRVQAYAAWNLALVNDARAVPRLIALMQHPVWRLRAMAAHALHASGDPRAADVMRAALTDPAWQVRLQAVQYFAAHTDAHTITTTIQPLLHDRHIAVRRAAASALTR